MASFRRKGGKSGLLSEFKGTRKRKSIANKAKEFAAKRWRIGMPLVGDWVARKGIEFLDTKIEATGHRIDNPKPTGKIPKTPKFRFKMPSFVDSGDFFKGVFINSNVEKPIIKGFKRTIGKKSKVLVELKKEHGPFKVTPQWRWKWIRNTSKKSWDNFACAGFNRKGVLQPHVPDNGAPVKATFYDCLGSAYDTISCLLDYLPDGDASDVEKFLTSDQFRNGGQDIYLPLHTLSQRFTYMNGNEFLPLYLQVYICTPNMDLPISYAEEVNVSCHPVHSWFDPTKGGQEPDKNHPSTIPVDEMNYEYAYVPTYDSGDVKIEGSSNKIIESSVIFGATPFFSKKFTERFSVAHVFKVRLLPQQRFILNLELEYKRMLSLQEIINDKMFLKKNSALIPLVTFYGESVIARDLSRVSKSPIDKTLTGSGPCILFHESEKTAKVIASPHLNNLSPDLAKYQFPDGTVSKSKTLDAQEEVVNMPYCNINSNADIFSSPYDKKFITDTPVLCEKKMVIKTTTDEQIKETGSIAGRES